MTKRRVKGEGSVYKRGDGRIVGEYEDAHGKRRYISGKRDWREARRMKRALNAVRNATPGSSGSADLFCGGCTEIILHRLSEQARRERLSSEAGSPRKHGYGNSITRCPIPSICRPESGRPRRRQHYRGPGIGASCATEMTRSFTFTIESIPVAAANEWRTSPSSAVRTTLWFTGNCRMLRRLVHHNGAIHPRS
jgi:hypothetical protein